MAPFTYVSLKRLSRFTRRGDPGLLYVAKRSETAFGSSDYDICQRLPKVSRGSTSHKLR